jgi:hypothetical protein
MHDGATLSVAMTVGAKLSREPTHSQLRLLNVDVILSKVNCKPAASMGYLKYLHLR